MKKIATVIALATAFAAPAAALQPPAPAPAQTPPGAARAAPTMPNVLILFERTEYNGQSFQVREARRNGVVTPGGNWPVRSFAIHPGDRWEICEQSRFRNCVILDRSVNDLSRIGLPMGRIGSTRQVTATPAAQ